MLKYLFNKSRACHIVLRTQVQNIIVNISKIIKEKSMLKKNF